MEALSGGSKLSADGCEAKMEAEPAQKITVRR